MSSTGFTTAAQLSDTGPRGLLLRSLPLTERHLELAGIATAVLEGGEGPPLVLLHGPGEHAAKWLRIVPDLVKTHRVVAPDLPGHGASAAIEGAIDTDRVLAWLGELIARTCESPPILVGQIIGGAIAARFAAAHGDRLSGLVLSDSLGLAPFQPTPEFGAALMAFATEPSAEHHDRLWHYCAFDLEALRNRMGENWTRLRAYNLDCAQRTELKPAQQSLFEQFGLPAIPAEELERIRVPTFLVWGRHDLATPLAVAEAASACYGWPLRVIEGAADDPPIEQPAAFLDVLRGIFLEGQAAGSPTGTRVAWDRIAPDYDRTNTETQLRLGSAALSLATLQPGMRFLDVAAGSGALSIPASRRGASVVAVDQSPVMLRLLRERAEREGLAIETRVMDGHALAFDDDSFDMAGSQFGVMLFPDMPKGVRELARVVRRGGRVLMVAYGDPRQIDFLSFFVEAVRSVRPEFEGPPLEPPPLPFQLSDPARLLQVLKTAGLRDVKVETIREDTSFESGDALWDWIISSNPIVGDILGSLDLRQGEHGKIRQALDRALRKRAGSGEAAILSNPVNIGLGTS